KVVSISELGERAKMGDELVEHLFLKQFQESDLKTGRNLLSFEMAKYYVQAFLAFDINEMKENGAVTLLKLEDRLQCKVSVDGTMVNLFGFADRVDKRGGIVRIIDYKTGMVKPADLKFDPSELA